MVRNVNGKFQVKDYIEFKPFKNKDALQFFLFDFHTFFDGLIGYESLIQFQADILPSSNTLKFPDYSISMNRKYPDSFTLKINTNEELAIELASEIENGEFYIENDFPLTEDVVVIPGLYRATNNKTVVVVKTINGTSAQINPNRPMFAELNNFEIQYPENSSDFDKSKLFDQIRLSHLNPEEKSKLTKLVAKYSEIFYLEHQNLTFTSAIKHNINTKDDIPVHSKSYRYPFCHKAEIQKQITKMLEQGIIRHSNSPWASPVWIVKKKMDASGKNKWRLVIDYRKLNDKTVADKYPIPNINDILDKLGRCMYFSTLDLASGFHQIEVDGKDIQKTAFNVEHGHYEFLRMPFGLRNAPSTFQRVMDNILREYIGKICLVYMDDIIVFSTSLQEHMENLSKIFEALRKYNMKVQLDKSEFLQKEVAFLGHIVTADGVKPNPEKIDVIKNWPIPNTEKDLRGFLGVLGYYRKFIRDFARIAKPLTNALRKGEGIRHSPEFVKSFESCKAILTSSTILQYPDFEKPFILTTDASNYAIGAVLSQGPVGSDKPVAFASRTLQKAEENLSTIEKELLAIVWGCKYFRPYLFGRKFTLYTDHQPLTYGLNLKNPNHKLIRWRLDLEEYDYEIKYRPGKQNVVADALSRLPQEININEMEDSDIATAHSADTDDSEFIHMTLRPINHFSNQIVLVIDEAENDRMEEIFTKVFRRTITRKSFDKSLILNIFRNNMDFKRTNCIMCPENLINTVQMVYSSYFSRNKTLKIKMSQTILKDLRTEEEQNELLEKIHNTAHRGIWENQKEISRQFYFPCIKQKLKLFIKLCHICNTMKYERKPYKIKFGESPIPTKPLEILHIDIFISQPDMFLSVVDKFSRFGTISSIKSRAIRDVRRALLKIFSTLGKPKLIICDNEPSLKSIEIRGLLHDMDIEVHFTPSNHSESNGIVERFHSTLAEIYRCIRGKHEKLTNKERYRLACTLYNDTIHSATKLKPREIFFGVKDGDERPLDMVKMLEQRDKLYDEVIVELKKSQNRDLTQRNQHRETEPTLEQKQTVFHRIQGIKNKTKPRYLAVQVNQDRIKTFIDDSNRRLHKNKIKRLK